MLRPLVLAIVLANTAGHAAQRTLDSFDSLSGWQAIHSHGDASRISIATAPGKKGHALEMDFSFIGFMGSVSIEKRIAVPLPQSYRLSFDIKGEGPINNLVIRLKDSLGNVWWVNRTDYALPHEWSRLTINSYQVQYGWGPSGGGDLRMLDRIEIMIDVVDGGAGKVWLDNLTLEELTSHQDVAPRVEVSSFTNGNTPVISAAGNAVSGWCSSPGDAHAWIQCSFPGGRTLGGLVIDWKNGIYPDAFDVLLQNAGDQWKTVYRVAHCNGMRNSIMLTNGDAKALKLTFRAGRKGVGVERMVLMGPEFAFSINEFFSTCARMAPVGYYPRYFLNKQSYWTVVGAPADTKEALLNEQGMIETDKLSFSLEPFLFLQDSLVTWDAVSTSQSLENAYLPVPSVEWNYRNTVHLSVAPIAAGETGKSTLLVRYAVGNTGPGSVQGKLFIAARPFQVNPPWQTFTVIGGAARVDSVICDSVLRVNNKVVIPLSKPSAMGCAGLDQGDITCYLRAGAVPPFQRVNDHTGYASAALEYPFDLAPGSEQTIVLAVPFHGSSVSTPPGDGDYYENRRAEVIRMWEGKIRHADIRLPAQEQPIVNTMLSNLGYILINADGDATQPGSRSYERSWIRDGSLTCTALLEMGIHDEVRRYIDWYAGFQYPDGKIPSVVETRGPEPTPENDSHGEFIYAVKQYFNFTRDTVWLREKWNAVQKTVQYIQYLRSLRKTPEYREGTPVQRACYGLVPESISHEGYAWKPQHSYWDDFFTVRGLKDARDIARVLGNHSEAEAISAELADLRSDLYASIQAAMKIMNVPYIPGCVELGDFSGLSTTVAVTPCDELGHLPDSALTVTFDRSYAELLDRSQKSWENYLPYEARFIGAFVSMDQRDRANRVLDFLMQGRRPSAWNEWAEVVWRDRDAPKSIGDMPHSWAASDFIRSVRSMLVYERERDTSLVIGAGIPFRWIEDSTGVAVSNLPTYFGPISYSMSYSNGKTVIDLSGTVDVPSGGIVLKPPLLHMIKHITGAEVNPSGEIVVRSVPSHIELE